MYIKVFDEVGCDYELKEAPEAASLVLTGLSLEAFLDFSQPLFSWKKKNNEKGDK